MQTNLMESFRGTPAGQEADTILRSCVHCGFCAATCPTYGLLGDELDSPRGRIYLIKQALEGAAVSHRTQLHLDRCLACRSCETTCPSGVRYGRLLDIGRAVIEQRVRRPLWERVKRRLLCAVIPYERRFATVLRVAQMLRVLLPPPWRRSIPPRQTSAPWPRSAHGRAMLSLSGCVQPSISPNIDAATARVLDRIGISLVRAAGGGCCGALSYHLGAHEDGLEFVRRNIDAWWPHIDAGAEAIVVNASGCGVMVKEYGQLLRNDPGYAERAARVSAMTLDVSEVLAREDLSALTRTGKTAARIAFHSPCSLQHGLKLAGVVESILTDAGFELTVVPDAHLCCGSAGSYSLLQPRLSRRLLHQRLAALESGQPAAIGTANIGCLAHLQSRATVPVKHWIELLDSGTSVSGLRDARDAG
ncbi:MAG: glycolate oxidase subunit GlcF [Acidiferrobacterales bacterium]